MRPSSHLPAAQAAEEVDVVVVGAGLLGFVTAAQIARRIGTEGLVVVDREPWLASVSDRIDRLEIGPVHPWSSLADAVAMLSDAGRELGDGGSADARMALEQCRDELEQLGLGRCWRHGRPAWFQPVAGDRVTEVHLTDRSRLRARHVVLAPGATFRAIPHWVGDLGPRQAHQLTHDDDLDLRELDVTGDEIAVVGPADLSLHLAMAALRRGAPRVEVVTPDPLHLDGVASDDLRSGTLCVRQRSRVIAASSCARQSELVLGDEERVDADRVWLATGTRVDLFADRSLRTLREVMPLDPGGTVLDAGLRWPGSGIHLVGSGVACHGRGPGETSRPDRVQVTGLVAEFIGRSLDAGR